jgi:hypothetical protein
MSRKRVEWNGEEKKILFLQIWWKEEFSLEEGKGGGSR